MSSPQTPQTSHSSHVDLDTLADLQEGLLEPEQTAAVAAHLDGCAECRTTRAGLDDVRALLRDGAADADVATPQDVVRRLDDALAAAAAPAAAVSATVTPLTAATARRARQPWQTRVLQAAAVFVLVAAVGGIGYGGIRALSEGNSSGDTTAASAGGGAGKRETRDSAAGGYRITSSGRSYTVASLRAAVPVLLAGTLPGYTAREDAGVPATPSPGSPESPAPALADKDNPLRLREPTALAACVANITGPTAAPVTPLAVDVGARFEKKPATIIVLPDPDDPSFVNAYAVAPDCPTGTWLDWEHVALP